MKIIEKIRNYFKIKSLFKSPSWSGWLSFDGNTNFNVNPNDKSYAFSCIRARAENVSRAKIYLYQKLSDGKLKEWTAHPFLDLINSYNAKNQSFRELLYRISVSLDLYGDAFVYILRDKINNTPWDLYFLPTKQVVPVLAKDLQTIESYKYTAGGTVVNYLADDIIHFQIPDIEQNLRGKATISGFNYTLEIDYLQNLFQKKYFENFASPGLVLETEKALTDKEFNRLKNELKESYEGAAKGGKSLLLENGVKSKVWSNNLKEAALVDNRNQIRDEIMTIFRVPKPIMAVTDGVNLANALTAIDVFTEFTIKPFVKINIEDKLNVFLNKNYKQNNLFVSFEYDEVDREKILKAYEIYLKYNVTTIDEIREMEGFGEKNNNKN